MLFYLFLKICGQPRLSLLTAARTHQRVCHACFNQFVTIGTMPHLLAHSCRNVAEWTAAAGKGLSSLACRHRRSDSADLLCTIWSVNDTATEEILKQIIQVAPPCLYTGSKRSVHIRTTENCRVGSMLASYARVPAFKLTFVKWSTIPSYSRHIPEQCLKSGHDRYLAHSFPIIDWKYEFLIPIIRRCFVGDTEFVVKRNIDRNKLRTRGVWANCLMVPLRDCGLTAVNGLTTKQTEVPHLLQGYSCLALLMLQFWDLTPEATSRQNCL
jgi:hypothetical protein